MRGHVLGVGDRRRGRRVRARGFEPVGGMPGIIVDMNQVVKDTRVLRILRVDLLEELCRESLLLEAFGAFLNGGQQRQSIKQLRLVVWVGRVCGRHRVHVSLISRRLWVRAAVLVEGANCSEIHPLARRFARRAHTLLHECPRRRLVRSRRRIPEWMVVGLCGAPVRYGAVRVALCDLRESLQRAGIPEVMEQREGTVEGLRDRGRARDVHVHVSEPVNRRVDFLRLGVQRNGGQE